MVIVSPQLYSKHISTSGVLQRVSKVLEDDDEVNELLRMSNIMAVTRLKYNDHGVVHAKIVAGTSLELLDLIIRRGCFGLHNHLQHSCSLMSKAS